jgi:hypothetical protein
MDLQLVRLVRLAGILSRPGLMELTYISCLTPDL